MFLLKKIYLFDKFYQQPYNENMMKIESKNLEKYIKINTFIYRNHEKNTKMDYHFHVEFELTYVLKGKIELEYIQKQKCNKITVFSNQMIIINKNITHKLNFLTDTTLLVLEIEDMNDNFLYYLKSEEIFENEKKILNFIKNNNNAIYILYDITHIKEKMKCLIEFEKRKRVNKTNDLLNFEFNVYFKDLLISMYKSYIENGCKNNLHLGECINYIHQNLSSDLSIANIAERLHISEPYLQKMFRKEMGISIYQYIINKRIDLAIYYLNNTSLSQKEIALQVGFKSYNSFYECFIKKTTKKPKEYRLVDKKSMQYFNEDFQVL